MKSEKKVFSLDSVKHRISIIINKEKRIYNKFIHKIFHLIKKKNFQKILLYSIIFLLPIITVIALILGLKVYSYTWFIIPSIVGFISIPLFFIPICFFFLKNPDLFEEFCVKSYKIFFKPWIFPILVVSFSIGSYIILSRLTRLNILNIVYKIPIIPIYITGILFGNYDNPTKYEPLV